MAQNNRQIYGRKSNAETMEHLAMGNMSFSDESANQKPIPFKICLIGDSSVGKTCLVERYINDNFEIMQPSLSAAFHTKTLTVAPQGCTSTKVMLQIWDTAGSEAYRAIN